MGEGQKLVQYKATYRQSIKEMFFLAVFDE
jgi:hypothetical protein